LQDRALNRIAALDLIRGVAVLGILAVNITGFAGPTAAGYSPHVPSPGNAADEATFALMLVLFEGKMRALFSVLFGASLLLFVEKADARGQDGAVLQFRRLCWLAVFGYLHFLLFWWGDILFLYAIVGILALLLTMLDTRMLLAIALLGFTAWQASGVARDLPLARAEWSEITGAPVPPADAAKLETVQAKRAAETDKEIARYRQGFIAQASYNLTQRPFYPFWVAIYSIGETLPFMLFGMVLLRTGFFTGQWSKRRLQWFAFTSLALGGTVTVAFAAWALAHHFPPQIMRLAINAALGFPHLLMALGYTSLLVLFTPQLLATSIGQRIVATGKMAFSNYIGTTVVMTAIFYGWGLGLLGTVPDASLPFFVLLGWVMMLLWSQPWLVRFGQGPLEKLWRQLTEMRWTDPK
jgi:uncharacterized protein